MITMTESKEEYTIHVPKQPLKEMAESSSRLSKTVGTTGGFIDTGIKVEKFPVKMNVHVMANHLDSDEFAKRKAENKARAAAIKAAVNS